MNRVSDCVFCQIVAGKVPCYQIFEDADHLAFLNIFPNTEAFSVVIPKQHHNSDFAKVSPKVISKLMIAGQLTAAKICRAYSQVDRCAAVFEGLMVNHLHLKIIPLHQTKGVDLKDLKMTHSDQYFHQYQGYITTCQPQAMADLEQLQAVADKINCEDKL